MVPVPTRLYRIENSGTLDLKSTGILEHGSCLRHEFPQTVIELVQPFMRCLADERLA